MFKERLPAYCPPDKAKPNEITLYRLFVKNEACFENFDCFINLFPENKKFQNQGFAFGISFFDSLETIKELRNKPGNQSKLIASVKIKEEHGKLLKNNPKKGQYTLWLFEDFKPETVKYVIIEDIE